MTVFPKLVAHQKTQVRRFGLWLAFRRANPAHVFNLPLNGNKRTYIVLSLFSPAPSDLHDAVHLVLVQVVIGLEDTPPRERPLRLLTQHFHPTFSACKRNPVILFAMCAQNYLCVSLRVCAELLVGVESKSLCACACACTCPCAGAGACACACACTCACLCALLFHTHV
jgi:hypothetical protein